MPKRTRTALMPDINTFPKPKIIGYKGDKPVFPESFLQDIDERLANIPYHVGEIDGWYPDMKQAEELVEDLIEDPAGNYEFIYWICESTPSLARQYPDVHAYLNRALIESIEFEPATAD